MIPVICIRSDQSLSHVRLFATPWIAARQASLSITNSWSSLRLTSIESWCHPAISSSVVPFSSSPQSLPASESFPMSQLFIWGGQSTGVSALASFLPKKSQGMYMCCVCIYTHAYILYVHVIAHICMLCVYTRVYIYCLYMCVYGYIYVNMLCVYIYTCIIYCMYIWLRMYICCVYIHVYIYTVFIYVYMITYVYMLCISTHTIHTQNSGRLNV